MLYDFALRAGEASLVDAALKACCLRLEVRTKGVEVVKIGNVMLVTRSPQSRGAAEMDEST